MRFEAILFDLGNTLITQNVKEKMLMMDALVKIDLQARSILSEKHGLNPSRMFSIYKQLYKEMNILRETFLVEIPIDMWLAKLLVQLYNERVAEKILDDAKEIIISARSSCIETFIQVPDILEELRSEYNLGIISNVSSKEVVYQVLSDLKINNFFDVVVTSVEFGVRKPYPGIFLYTLRKLKVGNIPSTVFVGDSIMHDIRGAKNVGMKTILVSKDFVKKDTDEIDMVIDEVKQVPSALLNLY